MSTPIQTVSNQSNGAAPESAAASGSGPRIHSGTPGADPEVSDLSKKLLISGKGAVPIPDRQDPDIANNVGSLSVVGQDDRIRITETGDFPWRMICDLEIKTSTGALYIGTGWAVSCRTIITAGHCVNHPAMGGWAAEIEVLPGRNESNQPYGGIKSTSYTTTDEWLQTRNPDFDYAAIHLPESLPDTVGSFSFGVFDDDELDDTLVNISGYPADKGGDQQWHNRNGVSDFTTRRLFYKVDTYGGQSGSPIFIYPDGLDKPPVSIGVHAYGVGGGTDSNSGPRINNDVFDLFESWIDAGETN